MKYVKIDPPGTFCTNEALRDFVRQAKPSSFIEVGCGDGERSKLLCAMGMKGVGVVEVQVWSVAVPTVNLLFRLSNWLVKRSAEAAKIGQSRRAQTETSGLRDIPSKTAFPSWVGLILNRFTLYPLFVVQRLFYRSGFGIILLGFGRVS